MKTLLRTIDATETKDGNGVKIRRIAGRSLHYALDPYLLLDEIHSDDANDYIGGFPEHPHRGFETITYMKEGRMRHRDHMGNEGVIGPGDVQWMTAGRGVIHSEMPEQQEGLLHGFQIWLNLPAAEKMLPADYQEIQSVNIPAAVSHDGSTVRAIAGSVWVHEQNLVGPLPERSTRPILLDIELRPNSTLTLGFESDLELMTYVYSGSVDGINERQLGLFSNAKNINLSAGKSGGCLLLLSGRKINEPVIQHGPLVMNTTEEIRQAISDLRSDKFV